MLGPLEVRTGPGDVLKVGGSRLRALLIMLALRPGQLVLASELIDGLWGESAPGGAANALQALVSRLRRALPGAVIESRPMREPLAGLLMRALAASGRRGAALEVYEQTRERLVDLLGVHPCSP
jgi:DNA-binding SARP family transcriptional activator